MLRTPIPTVPSLETAGLIDRADARRPDGAVGRRVGLSITIQISAVSLNGTRGAETEAAMHDRNSGSRSRFTKRFGDVGLDRAKNSEWRADALSSRANVKGKRARQMFVKRLLYRQFWMVTEG